MCVRLVEQCSQSGYWADHQICLDDMIIAQTIKCEVNDMKTVEVDDSESVVSAGIPLLPLGIRCGQGRAEPRSGDQPVQGACGTGPAGHLLCCRI